MLLECSTIICIVSGNEFGDLGTVIKFLDGVVMGCMVQVTVIVYTFVLCYTPRSQCAGLDVHFVQARLVYVLPLN